MTVVPVTDPAAVYALFRMIREEADMFPCLTSWSKAIG